MLPCLAVLILSQFSRAMAADYTITPLGTFGTRSWAYSINDNGQVTGYSYVGNSENTSLAFIWDNTNGMRSLGQYNGLATYGMSINHSGQIAGWAVGVVWEPEHQNKALMWTSTNGWSSLGDLGNGAAIASHINDSGAIVGVSSLAGGGGMRAFIWDSANGIRNLGLLSGTIGSQAYAINNVGQVVGRCPITPWPANRAFIWDTVNGIRDIGSLGGMLTVATDINNNGQVVGYATVPGSDVYHAFIWDSVNGLRDLGSLGSGYTDISAMGINDKGQVVGSALRQGGNYYDAFVWDRWNGMRKLGTLGVDSRASGVNNKGQVVGESDVGTGYFHAVLWNPVASVVSVPVAKLLPNGRFLSLPEKIVTYTSTNVFYVEEDTRSCGIRVEKANHGLLPGTRVDVVGTILTNSDKERYIDAATASYKAIGQLNPLGLPNESLGGGDLGSGPNGQVGVAGAVGLNNIGLLIRTWGKVTQIGSGYLYVDDGAHLKDGTSTLAAQNIGCRVICDPTGYYTGDYLTVTGVSSCFQTPIGQIARRLLPVSLGGIQKLTQP